MREITFKEFSKLMARRKRGVEDLVDLFRGKLDDSRSFFERVMSCQCRNPETGAGRAENIVDRGDLDDSLANR